MSVQATAYEYEVGLKEIIALLQSKRATIKEAKQDGTKIVLITIPEAKLDTVILPSVAIIKAGIMRIGVYASSRRNSEFRTVEIEVEIEGVRKKYRAKLKSTFASVYTDDSGSVNIALQVPA